MASSQVSYGTPLPELDEDEATARKHKPIAIEDQIVTDENGRRRFHGAFTGGFSAGFFNTAGSRDGWSPAHFKSSRVDRKEMGPQRPEDFMDAEDLGEFGIAPKGIRASAQFRQPRSAEEERGRKRRMEAGAAATEGPIPGEPVLDQILKPAEETIGTKLLRNMGWKPGQGIGPRLTRRQRRKNKAANIRMFGPSLSKSYKDQQAEGEDQEEEEDDDEEEELSRYKDFLFAPDDVPEFVANPKDNLFGIGYSGLDREALLGVTGTGTHGHFSLFDEPQASSSSAAASSTSSSVLRVKGPRRNLSIRGQAFGVGAYEEEDEDIYKKDDMSRYDFELGPEGRRDKKRKSRWNEEEEVEKVIEGFRRATLNIRGPEKKFFPPPELPRNYQPKASIRGSRFDPPIEERLETTNPTPSQRQRALQTPQERREEGREHDKEEKTRSDEQLRKFLATEVPEATKKNLSSFQPFAKNPEKQKRYEKYLVCVRNKREDALSLLQPQNMTEWEREREKVEFARAAMLYRPLTGNMSSKFVSAGSCEDLSHDKPSKEDVEASNPDAVRAAQLKMFGKLTHERVEWHPARMLCVRFNVKHPFGDCSVVGVRQERKEGGGRFELFGGLRGESAGGKKPQATPEVTDFPPKDEGEKSSFTTQVQEEKREEPREEEGQEMEVEPVKKPPIDLFKSIFLDSSDEDEEAEDKQEKKKVEEETEGGEPKEHKGKRTLFGSELDPSDKAKKMPWEEEKKNLLRNTNPAKGIFANVDFDALNRRKAFEPKEKKDDKVTRPSDSKSESAVAKVSPKEKKEDKANVPSRPRASDFMKDSSASEEEGRGGEEASDATFGPAKPPAASSAAAGAIQKVLGVLKEISSDDDSSSDEWTERKPSKKKKSKKLKKSKKKKKKHKRKSSKKKRRHTSSSSIDSSDSESD